MGALQIPVRQFVKVSMLVSVSLPAHRKAYNLCVDELESILFRRQQACAAGKMRVTQGRALLTTLTLHLREESPTSLPSSSTLQREATSSMHCWYANVYCDLCDLSAGILRSRARSWNFAQRWLDGEHSDQRRAELWPRNICELSFLLT